MNRTPRAPLPAPVRALLRNFRAQRPLRGGSLLITVFGDSIAPRGGAVTLGSLIRLAAPFGLTERLGPAGPRPPLPPLRRELRAAVLGPELGRSPAPRHRVPHPHAADPRISQDSPARSAAAAGAAAASLGGRARLPGVRQPVRAGVPRRGALPVGERAPAASAVAGGASGGARALRRHRAFGTPCSPSCCRMEPLEPLDAA